MNIYGIDTSRGLLDGGEIDGDLTVEGNGSFVNLDVKDTLTTDVIISRETVETKDALVHIAIDNVADTSNLGMFWEYNDGGPLYGGIIRDTVNKKIRVFEDQDVKPTPSSDISTYALGDLQCDVLESKLVTIGTQPAEFSLPTTRGTLGQVITATGVASTQWADTANPFDQSLNTTDDVKFNSVDTPDFISSTTFMEFNSLGNDFRFGNASASTASLTLYGDNAGLADFTIRNSSGAPAFRIESQGGNTGYLTAGDATSPVNCNTLYWTNTAYRFNKNLEFKREGNGLGVDTHIRFDSQGTNNSALIWARANVNKHRLTSTSDDKLVFRSDVSGNDLLTMDGTNLTIGTGVTNFTLPSTRGTVGQTLITDGAGQVTWQTGANPFDQTLNTTDTPSFVGLGLNSAGNATIFLRHSGVLKWTIQNSQSQGDILAIRDAGTIERMSIAQAGNVRIGNTIANTHYSLPTTRGTDGQVLKTDGSGNVSWQPPPNPFNQSLNTTDSPQFNQLTTGNINMLDADITGVNVIAFSTSPTFMELSPISNTAIQIGQAGVGGAGNICEFNINNITFDKPTNIRGALTMGLAPTSYVLPNTRGAADQILRTDGAGNVTWQFQPNLFDQNLNTTDTPTFSGLSIVGTGNAQITTNAGAGLNSSFISFQKGSIQYASVGVDLQNQLAAYNQTGEIFHSPVGTQNAVFSGGVTSTGTLTASNDWVHNQCAIEVYTDANLSPTACVLANTPYQVIFGSTTISFAHLFTAVTNPPNSFRITYNGTRARRFMLSCTLSFQTNTDTVNIDFFLYKNGVIIPGTKVSMHHPKAGPAPQSTQIQSLPQLNPGDFIDVYTSSNTPNVDVIVTSADIQCFCLSNLV